MDKLSAKDQKRLVLLDKGVEILIEIGYHGTGIKDILEQVNIPKGSFYYYFDSKESFAAEAIQHYIKPYIQRLQYSIDDHPNNSLEALEKYYKNLIKDVENSNFKGGCLLGNLMGELGDSSEICRDALISTVNIYRNLQESALLMAQNQNKVRKDLSARSMADMLFNNWQGALLRMKVERTIEPLNDFYQTLFKDYFVLTIQNNN